jgi:hypothetical protein
MGNTSIRIPDERIVEAIRLVFRKFRELSSARQVLLWAKQLDVKLPVLRQSPVSRRIEWQAPAYHTAPQIMLRRALRSFGKHYHQERNHQGLGNALIMPRPVSDRRDGPVVRRPRLGGLLNFYERAAA